MRSLCLPGRAMLRAGAGRVLGGQPVTPPGAAREVRGAMPAPAAAVLCRDGAGFRAGANRGPVGRALPWAHPAGVRASCSTGSGGHQRAASGPAAEFVPKFYLVRCPSRPSPRDARRLARAAGRLRALLRFRAVAAPPRADPRTPPARGCARVPCVQPQLA